MRHRPPSALVAAVTLGLTATLLASCSAAGDDTGADEDQIREITQAYITAVNTGAMTDVPALVCGRLRSTIPGGGQDLPESARKARIDSFGAISVDGDTATARVTLSVIGDPHTAPQTADMDFTNEDGWKLCR